MNTIKAQPEITVRRSEARGQADFGWLQARHSFSFGEYYDPNHMGFGPLRVINEDHIAPGRGFDTHPHRDMEIITYIISGALAHRDSMGHASVIRPGDVQRMTAGSGVTHSEINHSDTEEVHLLQIWIQPDAMGLPPGYEERHFEAAGRQDQLRLIASRDGRNDSLIIHQNIDLYAGLLSPQQEVALNLAAGHRQWVQAVQGSLRLGEEILKAGDAAALTGFENVVLTAQSEAEVLVFDIYE